MFIVFEGLDGSGSTTQAKLLAEKLQQAGKAVLHTSEPTENPIGKLIRSALQKEWATSPEALQLLFSADRAHHLQSKIEPALQEGKIVICDRYVWSTIAYGALKCDQDWLAELNKNFREPDFIFLLRVAPQICLQRISKRGEPKELFEEEEKLSQVWETFARLAETEESNVVLDGEKEIEVTAIEVWNILQQRFSEFSS